MQVTLGKKAEEIIGGEQNIPFFMTLGATLLRSSAITTVYASHSSSLHTCFRTWDDSKYWGDEKTQKKRPSLIQHAKNRQPKSMCCPEYHQVKVSSAQESHACALKRHVYICLIGFIALTIWLKRERKKKRKETRQ
jgi:hypothetical protein